MVKAIVEEINKSHREQIEPIQKELLLIDSELTKLTERKKNLFELYEDGLASKEDFMERKTTLNDRIQILESDKLKYQNKLVVGDTEVSYELVQQTLHRFGEQIGKCEDQEKLKLLLRLLIKEVTLDETREIESRKIHINDDIIRFLSGEEDVPNKGTSSFLVPYTINIEFCI